MLETEIGHIETKLRPTENLPIKLITDPDHYRVEAPRRPGPNDKPERLAHIATHMEDFNCEDESEFLNIIGEIASTPSERTRTYIDLTTRNIIVYDTQKHAVVVINRDTIKNLDDPPPVGEAVTAYIAGKEDKDAEAYVLGKLDGIKGTPWRKFDKKFLQ